MKPNQRYQKLEQHLSQENPVLLEILDSYKALDAIGYKTGLLSKEQSYAEKISWWPMISVLGTFSAGKSSFINQYLGKPIQQTGNQAIDDKFTVLCYGTQQEVVTLPGLALDSDPRFPFYGISQEIEKIDSGEGSKVDHYLQIKTTASDQLKGKILIDSPGFDADSQRSATLKITSHIMDMSDLVLVFFDARHPEPGAMRDTLEHLVSSVFNRKDFGKVLYILNQIDSAAQEDNPEEVIGSWQRALSSQGLVGGNFFAIYNEITANNIMDDKVAERFKQKKDIDLEKIYQRMNSVSTERTYRIAHAIELTANHIMHNQLPALQKHLLSWRKKVLWAEGILLVLIAVLSGYLISISGSFHWSQDTFKLFGSYYYSGVLALVVLGGWFALHQYIRRTMANWQIKSLSKTMPELEHAFRYNTPFWRGMFSQTVRGWRKRQKVKLNQLIASSKVAIQKLNDQYTDPSGNAKKESEN